MYSMARAVMLVAAAFLFLGSSAVTDFDGVSIGPLELLRKTTAKAPKAFLFLEENASVASGPSVTEHSVGHLRGRRLLDDGTSWRDRVKEKGETLFQEKKRAAIRAACYKDWWVQPT